MSPGASPTAMATGPIWSIVEVDPQDPRSLSHAEGSRAVRRAARRSIQRARRRCRSTLEVEATRWGPIVDHDARRPAACAGLDRASSAGDQLAHARSRNRRDRARRPCRRPIAAADRCRTSSSADAHGTHRLVGDGSGAGARELRLDAACVLARARNRLDGLAHAARSIRASSIRRRAGSGRRMRARSTRRPGSRSWAMAAMTSARAPRRSATICWRCQRATADDMVDDSDSTIARCF